MGKEPLLYATIYIHQSTDTMPVKMVCMVKEPLLYATLYIHQSTDTMPVKMVCMGVEQSANMDVSKIVYGQRSIITGPLGTPALYTFEIKLSSIWKNGLPAGIS